MRAHRSDGTLFVTAWGNSKRWHCPALSPWAALLPPSISCSDYRKNHQCHTKAEIPSATTDNSQKFKLCFFFLFKFSLHFWQQFLGTCNCSTEIRVSIIMLSLFNPATTDFRSCKSVNSFLQALTHICDIFSFTLPWCLHILFGRLLHQMSFYNHAQFQTRDLSRVNSYTSLLNYFI